jgi:hypothetical protein
MKRGRKTSRRGKKSAFAKRALRNNLLKSSQRGNDGIEKEEEVNPEFEIKL